MCPGWTYRALACALCEDTFAAILPEGKACVGKPRLTSSTAILSAIRMHHERVLSRVRERASVNIITDDN